MPTSIYHAKWGSIPKESRLGGNYLRSGMIMDQALCSFVQLNPKYDYPEDAPPDQHPFDQMMIMLEGRLDMILNGTETYRLEEGDALYIPGNVPHTARLVDKQGCRLVEIFAPIRTDYLHIAEHQTSARAAQREADGSREDKRPWSQSFSRPYLKK